MLDPNQIIIISATTVMTVLLTIIGIQLIFVLRDLRNILSRVNKITKEFDKIGAGVGHSYSEIMSFVSGIGKLVKVIDLVSKKRKKTSSNDKKQ